MKKPTPEQFAVTQVQLDRYEQQVSKNEIRVFLIVWLLTLLLVPAIAIGAEYGKFRTAGDVTALLIVYGLSGIGSGFLTGATAFGLYHLLLRLSPVNRRIGRYKDARTKYDMWWNATQRMFWLSLSGKRFELELACLYKQLGYEVTVTPTSGDEGIDIILKKNAMTTIVQCKAHKKPVGPSVARDLYGTLLASKADNAILASVSGFTTGVREFARDKPIELLSVEGIIELHKSIEV